MILSLTKSVRFKVVYAIGVLISVSQVGFSKSWRHENRMQRRNRYGRVYFILTANLYKSSTFKFSLFDN